MTDQHDAPHPSVPNPEQRTPAIDGKAVLTGGEWLILKRPNFTQAMAELAENTTTDE